MKVLVIDEWLPWPLETGKKIRSFNLISRLAKQHDIHYLAYVTLPQEREKIDALEKQGIKVISVKDVRTPKWTMKFYLEVLINLLSTKPFSTAYHIKKVFIVQMRQAVESLKPDIIHCEWSNLAPFLAGYENIPRVIAAHNVESDIWKRLAENGPDFHTKLLGKVQAKRIERLEREWYPAVEHCIAVSREDQDVIESYGAKVSLVENGVDLQHYDYQTESEINQNSLVFVASFDTFSNQDGVHFFMNEIFPKIIKQNAGIDIWLVGKNPPDEIKWYSKKYSQIHVTGTVPDVRTYIAKCPICIVPLRIGGGSRLKILEAMAMKKPVISTTIGAEGLRIKHGENIILTDTPEDFAQNILVLLADQHKQTKIGDAGFKLVKYHYDWSNLAILQGNIWSGTNKN